MHCMVDWKDRVSPPIGFEHPCIPKKRDFRSLSSLVCGKLQGIIVAFYFKEPSFAAPTIDYLVNLSITSVHLLNASGKSSSSRPVTGSRVGRHVQTPHQSSASVIPSSSNTTSTTSAERCIPDSGQDSDHPQENRYPPPTTLRRTASRSLTQPQQQHDRHHHMTQMTSTLQQRSSGISSSPTAQPPPVQNSGSTQSVPIKKNRQADHGKRVSHPVGATEKEGNTSKNNYNYIDDAIGEAIGAIISHKISMQNTVSDENSNDSVDFQPMRTPVTPKPTKAKKGQKRGAKKASGGSAHKSVQQPSLKKRRFSRSALANAGPSSNGDINTPSPSTAQPIPTNSDNEVEFVGPVESLSAHILAILQNNGIPSPPVTDDEGDLPPLPIHGISPTLSRPPVNPPTVPRNVSKGQS